MENKDHCLLFCETFEIKLSATHSEGKHKKLVKSSKEAESSTFVGAATDMSINLCRS